MSVAPASCVATLSLFLSVVLLIPSCSPQGEYAEAVIDDRFKVEYYPESLELKPDEMGSIHVRIRNIGNKTIWVGFKIGHLKTLGHSVGTATPDYFQLEAGEMKHVMVHIRSQANYLNQEAGGSDAILTIYWGAGLEQESDGGFDRDSIEGSWKVGIPVADDFSEIDRRLSMILVIVILIIIIIAGFVALRRKGRD